MHSIYMYMYAHKLEVHTSVYDILIRVHVKHLTNISLPAYTVQQLRHSCMVRLTKLMVAVSGYVNSNGVEHWNHVPSFRHHTHCRERGGVGWE